MTTTPLVSPVKREPLTLRIPIEHPNEEETQTTTAQNAAVQNQEFNLYTVPTVLSNQVVLTRAINSVASYQTCGVNDPTVFLNCGIASAAINGTRRGSSVVQGAFSLTSLNVMSIPLHPGIQDSDGTNNNL